MKKLNLLLLTALSSALLLTACGKKEEPQTVQEASVVDMGAQVEAPVANEETPAPAAGCKHPK